MEGMTLRNSITGSMRLENLRDGIELILSGRDGYSCDTSKTPERILEELRERYTQEEIERMTGIVLMH